MKNNKYLIFALVFAVLNMAAVIFIFGFRTYGDTSSYINAIHWFQGESVGVLDPWVVLKPLGILLALPFEFLGAGAGLVVQNIVFYLLSAFLMFKIADLLFDNPFDKLRASKKQALLASIFFVTATQVLEVGLAYLTDMGAWFFYLLSIFLTLLYLKNKNGKLIMLAGFLSGVGVLMKENGGLGALFFGLVILLSKDFKFKEKIFKILRFAGFFAIPILAWQIFMYQRFQLTSLDWYLFQLGGFSHGEGTGMVILKYFGQLFRTLGILWIFFFIGLWREIKEKNWQRLKIYLALLPGSLSFFLWPISAGGRSVFVFAPLGILLASYGFKKMKSLLMALIISAIFILNYAFAWFNPAVSFVNIAVKFLGI
ncbi:MAG: glycosyltransferase family 39 protein [bacterium]|nr:glycosyltransferase family 39 protein [bacterium]